MPEKAHNYVLAMINSVVGDYFLHVLNPTMSFQSGNIGALPVVKEKESDSRIVELSNADVELCKRDWDSFETSWDFAKHPLVRLKDSMKFTDTDGDRKIESEPFPGKRTRKYPKNRNESLIFCGMLVHAA